MDERLAFLFSGQGSQRIGMAEQVLALHSGASVLLEEAEAALDISLGALLREGPASELERTQIAQPAILFVGVAEARYLIAETGLVPAALAGHSLGQYAALVVAGALDFGDAVRLVAVRARLMQQTVPIGIGAMAAVVGAELDEVEDACRIASTEGVVQVACYNAPGQVVISGHRVAVDRAAALLEESGAGVLPLSVSAPFHCSLLEPMLPAFSAQGNATPLRDARIPVIDNVTAEPIVTASAIRTSLVRQVTAPVRFEESIRRITADGIHRFVQCGSGKGLLGFAARVATGLRCSTFAEAVAPVHGEPAR
jgi:[acyl-carrier-protein] S-malonyltransferase